MEACLFGARPGHDCGGSNGQRGKAAGGIVCVRDDHGSLGFHPRHEHLLWGGAEARADLRDGLVNGSPRLSRHRAARAHSLAEDELRGDADAHEAAVRLDDDSVLRGVFQKGGLPRVDVGMQHNLVAPRLAAEPDEIAVTYLVDSGFYLGRAEERLQVFHLKVADADAPEINCEIHTYRGLQIRDRTDLAKPSDLTFSIWLHTVGISGEAKRGEWIR